MISTWYWLVDVDFAASISLGCHAGLMKPNDPSAPCSDFSWCQQFFSPPLPSTMSSKAWIAYGNGHTDVKIVTDGVES